LKETATVLALATETALARAMAMAATLAVLTVGATATAAATAMAILTAAAVALATAIIAAAAGGDSVMFGEAKKITGTWKSRIRIVYCPTWFLGVHCWYEPVAGYTRHIMILVIPLIGIEVVLS